MKRLRKISLPSVRYLVFRTTFWNCYLPSCSVLQGEVGVTFNRFHFDSFISLLLSSAIFFILFPFCVTTAQYRSFPSYQVVCPPLSTHCFSFPISYALYILGFFLLHQPIFFYVSLEAFCSRYYCTVSSLLLLSSPV
jgi:hypothetical protein